MERNAVICGAGRIGRGYLAEILQNGKYHITFLVHNPVQNELLKNNGQYIIFRGSRDESSVDEIIINDYDCFCTVTEEENCIKAIFNTGHVFLPVYPSALPDFGRMIGKAINLKAEEGNEEYFNIYMCVNFMKSSDLMKEAILPHLSEKGKEYFEKYTGVAETLVGRLCVDPNEEMRKKDPLSLSVAHGDVLKVDEDSYKGELPDCDWIVPFDRIPARFTYKIWDTNMKHFSVSVYGDYLGYSYVREAVSDERVEHDIRVKAHEETVYAVAYEYGLTPDQVENDFRKPDDPWYSWKNPNSNDPFDRVLRDMRRKLAKNDRLVGPALACLKGGKIPFYLSKAIALALVYFNGEDPTCVELHEILENGGVRAVLHEFSSLSEENREESLLMDLVEGHYDSLKK